MTELLFNPFDPAFRADPYPFYDRLRETAPAYRTPLDTVVLSRYDDVSATLRSSDFSRDVAANAKLTFNPLLAARRQVRDQGTKSILNLDPPDHTRLRRLVSKAFTPSAIESLRPRIQSQVDEILDQAAERGSMELVDELAFPVPFQVISDLLAMPTERADELRSWSQSLTAALEPTADEQTMNDAEAALAQLLPYLVSVIEHRRSNLGTDMLSALLVLEEAGDRLTMDELVSFVVLLYVAGHETTVNLIGNGTLALLRHPDQLRSWAADPSLDSNAVDELLRYDGPVQLTVRVAMKDMVIRGESIDPGTVVMTSLGAANHDPAVFDHPHSLRLDRHNAGRHVALSGGIHYCLGASLAKLEAQVAIGSLIRRFPDMQLSAEPTWRDRLAIRGVDHMALSMRN